MMKVLEQFGFGSLGISKKDFLHPDKIVQFGVEPLRIDVITAIDGIGKFSDAYPNRDRARYDQLKINFIGYQDLIQNKKASARLQDQRDVQELEKVRNERNK